jgi:hypothetical protein
MKRALTALAAGMIVVVGLRCTENSPTGQPQTAVSLPYMHQVMVMGGEAYVMCQRLVIQQGQYGPTPMPADSTGLLVVLSTTTDAVTRTISLRTKNPASMDSAGGMLYVASSGSFYQVDSIGGLERVDPTTGACTVLLREYAVGGDISGLSMVSSAKGYLQVTDPVSFSSRIVEFDPQTGTIRDTLGSVENPSGGMVYDGRYLYVGDRSTGNTGVVVIDPVTNTKVGGTLLGDGLPPYSLCLCRAGGTTYVVVGTSDYATGNIGIINTSDWTTQNNLKSIYNDNKVVGCDSSVYVMELYGQDRITRYRGVAFDAGSLVWQASMGSAVNIHDVAIANGEKGYVARYQSDQMLVIKAADGTTIREVDLSGYGVVSRQ